MKDNYIENNFVKLNLRNLAKICCDFDYQLSHIFKVVCSTDMGNLIRTLILL